MVTYAIHANSFFLSGGPTGPGYLTVTDGVFGAFSTDAPSSAVSYTHLTLPTT